MSNYKYIDLTGRTFGYLEILGIDSRNIRGRSRSLVWICRCKCKNIVSVKSNALISGHTKSCGCYHRETSGKQGRNTAKNLCGKRFGKLLALLPTLLRKKGKIMWMCSCDCGNFKLVSSEFLLNGHTKSCGCYILDLMNSENNPNWRNGNSKQRYPKEWTKDLREKIRNRDDRKCQYPDCKYDDTIQNEKLHVHHIDGIKDNCEEWNLISLCLFCHQKIEHNQPRSWENHFYLYTRSFE